MEPEAREHIFLLLSPDERPDDIVYSNVSSVEYEIIECLSCQRRWQGKQLSDVEIELYGESLEDLIWSDGPEIIVTQNLLDLLQKNHILGFSSRRVSVNNRDEYTDLPKLYQLIVTGQGGHIQATILDECQVCGWVRYAPPSLNMLAVDRKQWDGSDIFALAEFPNYPIITDRFRKVLHLAHTSNYQLIPVSWM